MTMSKKQAFQIIEFIKEVYDLKFTENKLMIWINLLTEDGDYEPTFKMAKKYIKSGNPYPPKLPNILRKEPKVMEESELDQRTKEHRWRMENDENYRKRRQQALDAFKKKVTEFSNRGDGDVK